MGVRGEGTPQEAGGPARADGVEVLREHESSRYRAAAAHALRVHPGPVGEVIARELLAYAEFGYRFDDNALIPRLAAQVLATPSGAARPPRADAA